MDAVQYVVDKTTQTFTDALLATGIAVLLQSAFGIGVRIRDAESGYIITLDEPLDEDAVESAGFVSVLPYLLTAKTAAARPRTAEVVDYEAWKQRQSDYWAQRSRVDGEIRAAVASLPAVDAEGRPRSQGREMQDRWKRFWDSDEGRDLQALLPPAEWSVYQAVNQMSGISAYNGAVLTWEAARPLFQQTLGAVMRAFSTTPNDLAGAESAWRTAAGKLPGMKLDITWSQIFNPASGKGQNRAKMDGVSMGNSSGFWLWEYLKYLGAKEILAPRTIQSNDRTKDRKSYVLAPASLDLDALRTVAQAFQSGLRSFTAVKMDILAVLSLTQAILEHLPEYFEPDKPWSGMGPDRAVRGLYTAYYKYLGTSAAVMNLSFLSVPAWMRVHGRPDIDRYSEVLAEQRLVVSRIEEGRSEGYELLRTYRDFLSEGSVWPFLEFCAGYGAYLMSDWERPRAGRPPARQMSVSTVQEVILGMDQGLSDIVSNEGFKAIANAIRRATVTPQYQKSRGQARKYEIRYGLGTELMRKANYDGEFAAALAEFVHAYNAENAQKAETQPHPPYRRNVRAEDLTEVIRLIDECGAKLVGPLLVAFGYATERGETTPGEGGGPAQGPGDAEEDGSLDGSDGDTE